jgi:GT2 family glycosyltransferase
MSHDREYNLIVGFITYREVTAKYLPFFLPSLAKQTFKEFEILVVDNTEEEINVNSKYIQENYPDIKLSWSDENIGFARAYNRMIEQAMEAGTEYFLALNPDMILEINFIEKALKAIKEDDNIAAIAPRILKWNFENSEKTNIVDSYGLGISKEHRFFDLHQGEKNIEELDSREVFGFTGGAVLFRVKALQDIAHEVGDKKEYFDELMFMYKEDCDLSYRLRLAGWKIVFEPSVKAYHDRTANIKGKSNIKIALNRKNKSRQVKKWSFLNHWILLCKIRKLPFSFSVKIATCWYQIKSMVFVLLFEQYLLKEFFKLYKLKNQINNKSKQIKVEVDIKDLEKFME